MTETACVFCQIANHSIPVSPVYEDDHVMAFNDLNPQAPVHMLVIPKKHIRSLNQVEVQDVNLMGQLLFRAKEIASAHGIDEPGFRCVINTGRGGGQTVFHLHLHILGNRPMSWPPG